MAFKELFSKYKVYTIISIIAILLLVAGGVTAGLFIGKQGNEQLNVPALAADFTDTNGLEYTILSSTDLTVSVSGYSGSSTTVVIPETVSNGGTTYTVTTIAGGSSSTGAFAKKTTLTSITIPSSITTMQRYAFYNCTALTEINFNATNMNDLPDNNRVFYNVGQGGAGITVNIGANVTKIPAYLFHPINGNSYAPKIVTVNFAEGSLCESIGRYAFRYCSSLTSITIPDSVTSIGIFAFSGCSSLTSITITNSVTSIGEYAFWSCGSLTSITIPDSVTSIGSYAFSYCRSLTSITIPDSVTSIGNYAFSSCTRLTSITIPDSVTSIGSYAFEGCSSLTEVTIPNSVTSIGEHAFYVCNDITSVYYLGDITGWVSIDFGDIYANPLRYAENLYFNGVLFTGGDIVLDTVTSIGVGAFYGQAITSATIGNQVTSIGEYAFSGCGDLSTIVLGNGLTEIGEYAFSNTPWLTDIGNNHNGQAQSSDGTKTYMIIAPNTNITSYDLTGVYVIAGGAFYGCNSLTSITIPDSVTSIGYSAFRDCTALTEINFNAINMGDVTDSNVMNDYPFYGIGEAGKELVVNIGANVTRIPARLFYSSENITKVTFAENGQCESIGERAFDNCTALTEINFNATNMNDLPYDNHVFSYAGQDGTGITVNIGANVTKIPAYLFCPYKYSSSYAPNIITVNFAENSQCESIGDYAFYDCSSLTSITIPNSVTSIGKRAFYDCSSLTSITIPNSVTSIGDYAFYDCSSLTSITIGNSVTSIGSYAFSSCRSLTSITIPDSVTSIGSYAFSSCRSLNNVYFYNNIQNNTSDDYIGRYAFLGNASTVTYWVKDSTSLNNIQTIYNDDYYKFTSKNFQVIASLTITTDASLGQIFINGELTTNYNEVITDSGITISNVIALPKANCAFLYWLVTTESGSTQVTDNPLSRTITETTTITAVFSNSLIEGVGVTAIGGGQVRMGGYEGDIDENTQVTLNAICYSGYTFDGWYTMENGVETKLEEFGNSDAITINVSVYEGKLIIAKFTKITNEDINEDLDNS